MNESGKATQRTRDASNDDWTMVHRFFANARRFALELEGRDPLPVTGEGVTFLCSRGLTDWLSTSEKDTEDRSKQG